MSCYHSSTFTAHLSHLFLVLLSRCLKKTGSEKEFLKIYLFIYFACESFLCNGSLSIRGSVSKISETGHMSQK